MFVKFCMMLFAKQNNGEMFDLIRLDQCEGLKKFIQGSVSTRDYNKCVGIFSKQYFPHKEIINLHPAVKIPIRMLLCRKQNITAHRPAARFLCSSICRFHNSGASSCHYGESEFCKFSSYLLRLLIIGMLRGKPR